MSDRGAGDDGFACTGWSDEDSDVVGGDLLQGLLLVRLQHGVDCERVRRPGGPVVRDVQTAFGLRDQARQTFGQAARQDQVAAGCLLVGVDEPRNVPRGGAAPLPLVKNGFGIEAACLRVATRSGGRSALITAILLFRCARMAAGTGIRMALEVAGRILLTAAPTLTSPSWRASRVTSRGVNRTRVDR